MRGRLRVQVGVKRLGFPRCIVEETGGSQDKRPSKDGVKNLGGSDDTLASTRYAPKERKKDGPMSRIMDAVLVYHIVSHPHRTHIARHGKAHIRILAL